MAEKIQLKPEQFSETRKKALEEINAKQKQENITQANSSVENSVIKTDIKVKHNTRNGRIYEMMKSGVLDEEIIKKVAEEFKVEEKKIKPQVQWCRNHRLK